MKAAVLYTVIASVSFSSLNVFGQSCTGGGGNHASPTFPTNLPTAADVNNFLNGGANPAATPATPAVPTARITIVDPAAPNGPAAPSKVPSATIRVVDPTEPTPATSNPPSDETIDPALAGLIGTWRAVARHGDGELTTIELRLDNRGWAKLTMPATDGTKSTIERRVEFKNQEIKLTEAGHEYLLGKLVSVSARQLVLDQAGGQQTFVRL